MSGAYAAPVSFATCVDWFFGKLVAFEANAQPALRTLAQRVVDGSVPELQEASAIRAKMNKKAIGKFLQVVVAAVARPDEQHRPSSLRSMLNSFV